MFFLLFLLDDKRIRIREAQKHMDPTDPDPDLQHWKVGTDLSGIQNNYSARDPIPLSSQAKSCRTHLVVQELLKSCEKLELLDCSFCEQLKLNIRQLRHNVFFHST
jgi:hypothetical protein